MRFVLNIIAVRHTGEFEGKDLVVEKRVKIFYSRFEKVIEE